MDNMASAKSLSTTPFSINDILTRNNTSIFRRIADESPPHHPPPPHHSTMDKNSRGTLHRRGFHQYRQCDSPIPDNVSSDTEDTAKNYGRQSPVYYYHNNNNNNNNESASRYAPHGAMILAKAGDGGARPRSMECYLASEDNGRIQRNRRKSDEYFMSAETALDMRRRCASNDSGE